MEWVTLPPTDFCATVPAVGCSARIRPASRPQWVISTHYRSATLAAAMLQLTDIDRQRGHPGNAGVAKVDADNGLRPGLGQAYPPISV